MEKPFSDDSNHRKLDDINSDLDIIKKEEFDTLYYIKTELDDEENVSLPFIHDDRHNLDVKPSLYKCTACNIQFTELGALKEHFAVHENDNGHTHFDKHLLHEYQFELQLADHLKKEELDTLNKLKQEDESGWDIKDESVKDYRTQLTSESDIQHNSELLLPVDFKLKPDPVLFDDGSNDSDNCPTTKHKDSYINLEGHMFINSSIKERTCDICQKSFALAAYLNKHKLIHSTIKNHMCNVCQKSFTVAADLKQHKLIHSDIKEHKCDVCRKSFNRASNLKRHKLIHSDIKEHKCDMCQTSCRQADYLKKHKLIHSGIKEHTCDVCGKSFNRAGHLKQHKLIHPGFK